MQPAIPGSLALPGVRALDGIGRFRSGFWLRHLGLPFVAYLLLMLWLAGLHGDLWLADRVYALEGHAWALQRNAITEQWLHLAARRASTAAWLFAVLAWSFAWIRPGLAAWRRPLGRLALSVLLATALVSWMKSWTGVHCPWDLSRYGGTQAWHDLFHAIAANAGHGGCFPAGHASAGYAWVALYFFFADLRPRRRWLGLAIGLGAGAVFGIAQQLRGAHFLSHDLTALILCWGVAVLAYRLLPARAEAAA